MNLKEVNMLSSVKLLPRHGGRGCDTYHAEITYRNSRYAGLLDFSGGKKILSAYSLELSHDAADNLIYALNAKYGAPVSNDISGNGVVVEKKWRVQSVEVTVKKIPNEAWIEYVDSRFKCNSNIEY